MQSEPTEPSQNASVGHDSNTPPSTTHHGLFGDPSEPSTPPALRYEERGSIGGSSTEWSLSPTSEVASPGFGSTAAGLSSRQPSLGAEPTELDLESLRLSLTPAHESRGRYGPFSRAASGTAGSTFHDFPEGAMKNPKY